MSMENHGAPLGPSPSVRNPGRRADVGKQASGRFGENLAARWYLARGYRLLARNWRCPFGELDIVAAKDGLVVFCEVKARSSLRFGLPAEAVGPLKQARARRVAAAWFAAQSATGHNGMALGPGRGSARAPGSGGPVRFDVATVLSGKIEVVEGAF